MAASLDVQKNVIFAHHSLARITASAPTAGAALSARASRSGPAKTAARPLAESLGWSKDLNCHSNKNSRPSSCHGRCPCLSALALLTELF